MRSCEGRDGPGETPAIAMEHWEGPQISQLDSTTIFHVPAQDIPNRIQVSASVVQQDTLGISSVGGRQIVWC